MCVPYYGDSPQDPQDAAKERRMADDDNDAASDWFDAQAVLNPRPRSGPTRDLILTVLDAHDLHDETRFFRSFRALSEVVMEAAQAVLQRAEESDNQSTN